MDKKNQIAFEKFDNFLMLGQTGRVAYDGKDIRQEILSNKGSEWNIGFVRSNLKKAVAANLPSLLVNLRAVDDVKFGKSNRYILLGTTYKDETISHKGMVRALQHYKPQDHITLIELGFLASSHSWSEAFKSQDKSQACLGYVYDDIAHYFMADYPNRLIHKLNSEENLSDAELKDAQRMMKRIVDEKVSKYNSQPFIAPAMTQGYKRRVLVCDQAYADASTLYGKIDENGFEQMLLAAINENPDAEILVKTHPDTTWEKKTRKGYYSHLKSAGRVRIIRDLVNPYSLFELVDTVYVGTSQMGLEALFAGKKVVCFGAPFYGGWGLTDDRQAIPHRRRARALEDIFHYFYVWYTIYHVPGKPVPSTVDDALDFIIEKRPFSPPVCVAKASSSPKISIIIPVYGVERYIEQCVASVQRQSVHDIEIITVNDQSPDGSQAIIDRLAAQDARIKPIILKENIGQGFARNIGIEHAKGDYIWFLDSDDFFNNTAYLQTILDAAIDGDHDMVRGRKSHEQVEDENGLIIEERQDKTETFFEKSWSSSHYKDQKNLLFNRHFWTWLYKRSFILEHDIRFINTQWEERPFFVKALIKADKIASLDTKGLVYRVRRASTARRLKNQRDYDLLLNNFQETVTLFVEAGAHALDNPLNYHMKFIISQSIHSLCFDVTAQLVKQGIVTDNQDDLLKKIRHALNEANFTARDFQLHALSLRNKRKKNFTYELLIAALLAEDQVLYDIAVTEAQVPQDLLYKLFLQDSETIWQRDLTWAVNLYGRNERVKVSSSKNRISKKPRLIVHIGSTKTGSTYIQHLLEENRPGLLKQGILYPEVGLFWQEDRPHKQAGHAHFAPAANQKKPDLHKHVEAGLALMNGKIHTVILSSEAFFLNLNAHKIPDYFKGYDAEMIVYLRRQDEWANSQYCEFVAGGAVGRVDDDIEDWIQTDKTQDRLNYLSLLERWEEKIGQENIHVRLYGKEHFIEGDIVSDFAQATGLQQIKSLSRPVELKQNQFPFSRAHVNVIKYFNSKPFKSKGAYFNFIQETSEKIAAWRTENNISISKPIMMSQNLAVEIMMAQSENNSKIAERYFSRSNKLLFEVKNNSFIALSDPIYDEEFKIISGAYESAAPEVIVSKQSGTFVSRSQFDNASHRFDIINYGVWGWRLWALSPIVRKQLQKQGSQKDLKQFDKDPATYFHSLESENYVKLANRLYPEGNLYGPFSIFKAWNTVAQYGVSKLGGTKDIKAFKKNPIAYFRSLKNPKYKFIGRLLYPIGEPVRRGK